MVYVKCEEQVEAKETAEHPAHNITCEERVGTKEIIKHRGYNES
jgi:hypothetical protein